MPTTPRSGRRTSNGRPSRATSTKPESGCGQQSPVNHSPRVQDRIREWQQRGAGDAPPPDAVSVLSMPLSTREDIMARPCPSELDSISVVHQKQSKSREEEVWGTRKSPTKNDSAVQTPKKRVISDGHWKAKVETKDSRHSRSSKPPQTWESKFDPTYTSTDAQEDKTPRNRNSHGTSPGKSYYHTNENTQISQKEAVDKENIADIAYSRSNEGSFVDASVIDSNGTPMVRQYSFEYDPDLEQSVGNEHRQRFGSSKYADTLGRDPPCESLPDSTRRSKKDNFISKTKSMFDSKPDQSTVASNRLPSITAWLDEQPDPFVETNEVVTEYRDIEEPTFPKSQRRRSRKPSRQMEALQTADPNKIWDTVPSNPENPSHQTNEEVEERPTFITDLSQSDLNDLQYLRRKLKWPPDVSEAVEHLREGLVKQPGRDRRSRQPKREIHGEDKSQPQTPMSPYDMIGMVYDEYANSSTQGRSPGSSPVTTSEAVAADSRRARQVYQPSSAQSPHRSNESTPQAGARANVFPSPPPPPPPPKHNDEGCDLKRKLTRHEDLMSVLSVPRSGKSRRLRRTSKRTAPVFETTTDQDLLQQFVLQETVYGRELYTLVEGVIPVLLQSVLSKTDAATAAGLFTSSPNDGKDQNMTTPIIEMGIALERLKTLHQRARLQDARSFLVWAKSASRAYADYIASWRLGFQDIVINLAPEKSDSADVIRGMDRDPDGDIIDDKGRKVDVAYLLKRPLIRLKAFCKLIHQLEKGQNASLASEIRVLYDDLTNKAKQKYREEQARLEDEAAANVDSTRARDIRTMRPLTKVDVDRSRKVRARDCFGMTLYHSNGQRLDCRVEIIIRDNAGTQTSGGDVLICEIDGSGKWLLFAPVDSSSISARKGDSDLDLIVMIRGIAGIGKEWHELLALRAEDSETPSEWLSMLGSNPLPPHLNRQSSFNHGSSAAPQVPPKANLVLNEQNLRMAAELTDQSNIDVPVGEPSMLSNRLRPSTQPVHPMAQVPAKKPVPKLGLGGGLQSKPISNHVRTPEHVSRKPLPSTLSTERTLTLSSDHSSISDWSRKELPPVPLQPRKPLNQPSDAVTNVQLSFQKTDILSQAQSETVQTKESRFRNTNTSNEPSIAKHTSGETMSARSNRYSLPATTPANTAEGPPVRGYKSSPLKEVQLGGNDPLLGSRVQAPNRATDPPAALRGPSHGRSKSSPPSTTLNESMRDQWLRISHVDRQSQPDGPKLRASAEQTPVPPSSNKSSIAMAPSPTRGAETPARAPPHHDPSEISVPKKRPVSKQAKVTSPDKSGKRHLSSPLKHEYAPSTASESSSDYDSDGISDSSSDTSDGHGMGKDEHTAPAAAGLVAGITGRLFQSKTSVAAPSVTTRTLGPSDSASQGPFRQVPATGLADTKKKKAIALICAWGDRGGWEQIHPDECSIVISPGLIEAYEMSAAHSASRTAINGGNEVQSRTNSLEQQPIVAFELTPIVPLRRGTALDISLRSPPTPNSRIRTTNNVMFRSRNGEECEALYNMINWARCNNPTYIALEKARPPRQPPVTFNTGQPHERLKSASWFGFGGIQRRSSYRASTQPGPTTASPSIGASEQSAGSMASKFSAFKRFTASSAFSLSRSSVVHRPGQRTTSSSLYSSSSGTKTGSSFDTPPASQIGLIPGKDGPNVPDTSGAAVGGAGMINNMKIRLYVRKGQNWENLGAGRLTVLPASAQEVSRDNTPTGTPPRPGTSDPALSPRDTRGMSAVPSAPARFQPQAPGGGAVLPQRRLPSSGHTPHRLHGNGHEKRVLVTRNKDHEVVLLDVVLGESCFERVMQTGIAVKVWTEDEVIGHTGGVNLGKERVYMMQLPSSNEAAWVFGLVGSYRYGNE